MIASFLPLELNLTRVKCGLKIGPERGLLEKGNRAVAVMKSQATERRRERVIRGCLLDRERESKYKQS